APYFPRIADKVRQRNIYLRIARGFAFLHSLDPGCVKTICVARESRILSNEQMSRHSDFATDGKKQSRFAFVRADLEFSHSLDPKLPVTKTR
ncbi:hypothetical protein, partial [Rhodanobacter sp. A1T4]|uniref:hypothetical protein n=1 Tax=Rhodanobacter sp. A1T4 TaxID=2723087 RepID=UPI001C86AAF8